MVTKTVASLNDLYETDETAWLDGMAELIVEGRLNDLDFTHLAEYLADMAIRDRREVRSRLAVLMAHLLKWQHQSENRTGSWRSTITVQRQDLESLTESGTLRNHAEAILAKAYADGVEQAADETGLPAETFPAECPWTLEQLLSAEVLRD